jgi:uncharacterized Fe-S cluster protein YjdI
LISWNIIVCFASKITKHRPNCILALDKLFPFPH